MENGAQESLVECTLERREQIRNTILFGAMLALTYLASPVTFVIIHAPLCKRLGASALLANLPCAAYLAFAALPVFVAWAYPQVCLFRRILMLSYVAFVAVTIAVVLAIRLPITVDLKIALVVVHGAITGGTLSVAISFLFELLGRGVSHERRGHALSLGYGVGPLFAVLGSLTAQSLLPAADDQLDIAGYLALFGLSIPVMSIAALLSGFFVVPLPAQECVREPFVRGLLGGLGDYLATPILRRTTAAAVLTLSGLCVLDNMTLYTHFALDAPPEEYLGYQQSLRFSFKIATGLFAGWLLTRTNPKALLLLTASIGVLAVSWALASAGLWYLLAFGLVGGGELFSVYILNYVLSCSHQDRMRRNLGCAVMLLVLLAPVGPLYGALSDHVGATHDPITGFRFSFAAALFLLLTGIGVTFRLPARPCPFDIVEKEEVAVPVPSDA